MFRIDVVKVDRDYCICYNGYTCMLQASVSNVLSVLLDVCCKCFYLDVAYVSHICLQVFLPGCCICFAMTFQVFLGVFASVSNACFKCFICLLLYVASVASGCFKSRSGCCSCCNGVPIVCSKCFIYFRCMLQRFHLDIAKVDWGVAWRS